MIPVILSGGSGTRLWPLSTPDNPKQFLPLIDAKQTMIQQTIMRLQGLEFMSEPLVICNETHIPLVKAQLFAITKNIRPLMLEPCAKNTAPAIAAASLYCEENENDGLMLVLPSDHTILNVAAFQKAITTARELAKQNRYVLFGIVPTHAETGYGYIEAGENEFAFGERMVQAFKEKPDIKTAERYVQSKNYFWNSGIFVIPAKLFLNELAQFNPAMFSKVKAAYEHATKTSSAILLCKNDFEKIDGNSIDYAVMEKTKNAIVLPLDAGWSDVGSWDVVWEVSKKDEMGNAINAESFCKDASGNFIYTESGKPIVLLGIKNCTVIESKNGLLVADMKYVQDVKNAALAMQTKKGCDTK